MINKCEKCIFCEMTKLDSKCMDEPICVLEKDWYDGYKKSKEINKPCEKIEKEKLSKKAKKEIIINILNSIE